MGTGIARYYPLVDISNLPPPIAFEKLLSAYIATDQRHFAAIESSGEAVRDEYRRYTAEQSVRYARKESGLGKWGDEVSHDAITVIVMLY